MNDKEFRRFIFPITGITYAAGVMFLVVSILPMISLGIAGIAFFLILFGLYLYYVVKRYRSYRSFLDEHIRQGDLEQICAEFSSAREWLNGGIRTGTSHIFCKKQPVLYTYSDILNLYEYVHQTNFITDQRCLCAVVRGGKRVNLCNLRATLKKNPEAMQLIQTLLQRNPSITLGYQNSKLVAKN